MPVKLLTPQTKEFVILPGGMKSHFKINTQDEKVPLKVKIKISQGIGYGFLSISQKNERPDRDNCDKIIRLTSKDMPVVFSGLKTFDKSFATEYVYITFEAEKDINLCFECCFGFGI